MTALPTSSPRFAPTTWNAPAPSTWRPWSKIAATYNGIGPEWLPKRLRNWLTDGFGYFAPAALVHDWEYRFSEDRSRATFTACNERLRRNSRRLLAKGYAWYKRWFYRRRPDLLADACQEFGWSAWQQA